MMCWICGAEAKTGEHLVKASDLRGIFGKISHREPLYLHTPQKRNQKVRGIKASILKSNALICAKCNNQRTQSHDRAWETLSNSVRMRKPQIKQGDRIRLNKIFPGSIKKSMIGVHLFFLKRFGCEIAEHKVPINLKAFSEAILKNKSHPYVHIAIGSAIQKEQRTAGGSDISVAKLNGHIVYAVWYYFLDRLTVRVVYAEPGEHRQGLIDTWHPLKISKCLHIAKV